MTEEFDYFYEKFGPIDDTQRVPPHYKDSMLGRIPNALIDYWATIGWGSYANGLFWSTDPADLSPVLDSWLTGCKQYSSDDYSVIARSAFGSLYLWGSNSGASITIDPLWSRVTTFKPKNLQSDFEKDLTVGTSFMFKEKDSLDFLDIKEKPMFSRAVKKLGKLKSDEMYAFEPALCIGGLPKIENLAKVKMVEHLILLSQMADIEFLHIDVSRHL